MKRQRVAAIIILNKKILLVRDYKADFFSMPGGTLENDEDHLSALARELQEEIRVSLIKTKYYFSFDLVNQTYNVPQTDHVFIAAIEGTPTPSSEIRELGWFSKDDIQNKIVKVPDAFYEKLFPKLVDDKLF